MSASVDVQAFRAAIGRRLGLQFDDGKLAMLDDVLHRQAKAAGCPPPAYVTRIEHGAPELVAALAEELTVGETYFFRNPDQFTALTRTAIPALLARSSAPRELRILSAGCATGEEPYSLAIAARAAVDASIPIRIRAVDVNPASLRRAAAGRYSRWAVRATPPDVLKRWFVEEGRDLVLDASVRGAVDFAEQNLARCGEWLAPESVDVVFCRNVLMYFAPDVMRAAVEGFARALVPGGYLFLGHAETLRGLSTAFHLCHTDGTFYYQRRDGHGHGDADAGAGGRGGEAARAVAPAASELVEPGVTPLALDTDAWVDTIRRATERVSALGDRAAGAADAADAAEPARARPAWDLGPAFELLRAERYAAALATLEDLPAESGRDPDVLLLRAVLHVHGGELAAAERAASALLAVDELHAGAHYVLALCREGAGDRQGAVEHDQTSVYLDPTFAMPRLHLGLMARRAGDLTAAEQELGQAQLLLAREDASRMLLFGGGFRRDALVALCRAELAACGSRR
jgi:chemotaxis protein methyltransferase CheR